jgi:hypothetical protein
MQYREVSVMRKITAEQLTRLDNILKCWVMKEIIKGNIKYVEFNQLDMDDVMIGQEWD